MEMEETYSTFVSWEAFDECAEIAVAALSRHNEPIRGWQSKVNN